ncbi:MAG: nucleotidyl transferase AbiEii/AbiGii toxin family protein [Candidatus Diapherotrites archaeon]
MDLISKARLQNIAAEKGFNLIYLEKDYFLTVLLYLIKDIKGLYFKGGTALNKTVFNHTRLSEDLDFTCTAKISEVKRKIEEIIKENLGLFTRIGTDKETGKFTRIQVFYKGYFRKKEYVNVDLNANARIHLKPEEKNVKHFYYRKIPRFSVQTLNFKELIAEKVSATFGRNAPRDYYDLYNIITKKIPVNIKLVKQKLKEHNQKFDINKIFKPGSKVYSRWQTDLLPLTKTKPEYKKVIKTIAKYFKYKQKK